jgi:protein transport protein SEC24
MYLTNHMSMHKQGNAGLHQELEENEEVEDEDLDTPVILPSPLNLSSEKLDRRSAFLLDDGQQLILWIGKAVHHDEVAAIFGSANPQAVRPQLSNSAIAITNVHFLYVKQFALAPNDDPDSTQTRIYNIVDGVRSQKPYWQRLTITMEGTTMDPKFFSHFIEDKQRNTLSYYEFLQLLQRNVSTKAAK